MKLAHYFLAAFVWLGSGFTVHADTFPRPDSLLPNVHFWERVYTEIDRSQGFLHDPRDLSIVYKTIKVPAGGGRKTRKRIAKREKQKLRQILKRIAGKPASALTGEEKRLRQLFGLHAGRQQIIKAANNIRFQLGQADKFKAAINRSGKYMPFIRQQFKAAGLPVELSILPFVESSFNTSANSHVGAAGIWQFMPATGRRFMKVNHVVDERYDPYRATQAAIRLLQYNHNILQSWPLALTAYNHGVGGMRRAIRQIGSRDMGVIAKKYRSRSFGFASRNFYSEFLAALDIAQAPEKYFPAIKLQAPLNYTVFKLKNYVPADALAQSLGVGVDSLRQHNLALREPVWGGEKRLPAGYELRIPGNLLNEDISSLLADIPASARFPAQVVDKSYRIKRGDSLSRIAALYNVSIGELSRMNKLKSRHSIRAGQVLYLPQRGRRSSPPAASRPATKPVVIASVRPAPVVAPAVEVVPVVAPATAPVIASVKTEVAVTELKTALAEIADMDGVDSIGLGASSAKDIASINVADQQIAATDPADYSVAKNGSIKIQAAETLGHYAHWLGLPTQWLRKLNGLGFHQQLVIGRRLKLDFSKVSQDEFGKLRRDFHKELEDAFFATRKITGTHAYRIRRGDSLWQIANSHAAIPLWLIRQYNPDNDFSSLKPGENIILPIVVNKRQSS